MNMLKLYEYAELYAMRRKPSKLVDSNLSSSIAITISAAGHWPTCAGCRQYRILYATDSIELAAEPPVPLRRTSPGAFVSSLVV